MCTHVHTKKNTERGPLNLTDVRFPAVKLGSAQGGPGRPKTHAQHTEHTKHTRNTDFPNIVEMPQVGGEHVPWNGVNHSTQNTRNTRETEIFRTSWRFHKWVPSMFRGIGSTTAPRTHETHTKHRFSEHRGDCTSGSRTCSVARGRPQQTAHTKH